MAHTVLFVYADASVQPEATGLGAVIRDERGELVAWRNAQHPVDKADKATLAPARSAGVTCNEAEYAALIFALEPAREFAPKEVKVFRLWADSRLVVEQMRGWISVHSPNLRPLHRQAKHIAGQFAQISFTHIPRERNQLADAIADDAIAGRMTKDR
jgi:probable phosphoglycerate mutase